jgi:hypothetical protein
MMLHEPVGFQANQKTPALTKSAAKRTRMPRTRISRRFSVLSFQCLVFAAHQPIPLLPSEDLLCFIVLSRSEFFLLVLSLASRI